MANKHQTQTPEKENNVVDMAEFRRKQAALRLRRILIWLTVIVILLVAGILFVRNYTSKVYESMEILSVVDWKPTTGATILPYGNDFISYSSDGIHCTNAKGQDIWSFSYVMQDPMVEVRGDYVAVADRGGRNIYIYDRTGTIGEISAPSPVQMLRMSAGGVVAAVLDDISTTPVYLYYHDGTVISYFRTTMSRSGYPAAIGISDDGRLVGVSYFYVDNGRITSRVAYYNFGEVGKNETDNLVSAFEYPAELVPMVEFLDDDSAFAVANNRLMVYEGAQRPASISENMLTEEVQSVYHGSGRLGLVYYDKSGQSKYVCDVYDQKGVRECSIHSDVDYKEVRFSGDQIIIYNSSTCEIYTSKGRLKYKGNFDDSVYLMLPGSSPLSYVLVTDAGLKTARLK
ncbi:MAG: hypothetical protein IKR23_11815 [Lachnospiraceae bacterium]|nr:hypothetical protein [Lachnospiraceae bacterium]